MDVLERLKRAIAYYDGYDGNAAEAGLILRDSVILAAGLDMPTQWGGWSERTKKEVFGDPGVEGSVE